MRRRYLECLQHLIPMVLLTLGLLLLPLAGTWGSRGRAPINDAERLEIMELQQTRRITRAHAVERPGDLSPFGPGFESDERRPDPDASRKLIHTNLGYINLKSPEDGVLGRVPAALRAEPAALRPAGAKGRAHARGVNIVQIGAAALEQRGYEAIESEIRQHARILHVIPSRGLVVRVDDESGLSRLAALPSIEAVGPYEPAYKVSPIVGRKPIMQAARARSRELELIVTLWGDADTASARAFLESVAGKDKVEPWSSDGGAYKVKGETQIVHLLARNEWVRNIREREEWMLQNSEVPTSMMIGTSEFSFGLARPYHDLGIDGGGLNASGLPSGTRVNNGNSQVPPQIVAVTDNGISLDAVHFSQTATEVTTLIDVGPSHRKVHSVQGPEETGTGQTCDAVLYGSNTHGNVVAGIIAGAPGDFGITFSKAIDPADGVPLSGISLDALARGARIIMQDAAKPDLCLEAELAEQGGNLLPGSLSDRLAQAVCPKDGLGTGLCSSVIGGGDEVHLHVMPFGVPNWDSVLQNDENGTYPAASRELDLFLINNRDYLIFSPVGSQGNTVKSNNAIEVWPDLFNGTALDNNPNIPSPLQMPPPATAKNVLTVGGSAADYWTATSGNGLENPSGFSSKGPATIDSKRTAPLVMAPATDGSGLFGWPLFVAAATNRSRDNDNNVPVERQLDEANSGTSFSAGYATAAGALVRDYLAQGFYPTGIRNNSDRMPKMSGALVRAVMVASADFLEDLGFDLPEKPSVTEKFLFNARALDLSNSPGEQIGVMGNGVQGYGRIVLDNVLPIANYPPTIGIGDEFTVEYPAAGLIIYDMLGTGEPPIDNGTHTQTEKLFTVEGVSEIFGPENECAGGASGGSPCDEDADCPGSTCTLNETCHGGSNASNPCGNDAACPEGACAPTRFIKDGQLRIALSWPDPPSLEDSGGELINDLDLEVESPGEDNDIATTGDNEFYHGNVYIGGKPLPAGQWGQALLSSSTVHDFRNNIEAMHLTSFVGDGDTPNQLVTGTWKVRVKRGAGGTIAGVISEIDDPDEDDDHDGRLDKGEDTSNAQCTAAGNPAPCCTGNQTGTCDGDADGLLDAGGQPFALVIAGPVLGFSNAKCVGAGNPAPCCTGAGTGTCDASWGAGTHSLPGSVARLDKYRYSCADQVEPSVFDPDATSANVTANVLFQVLDGSNNLMDEERGFAFTETATGSHIFETSPLPARFANPAIKNNGILEGDNPAGQKPWTLVMTYTDTPRSMVSRARFECTPNVLQAAIDVAGRANVTSFVGGGCDRDQFLDKGERVSYSIALKNFERADDLTDVVATLSASGTGASAITVLDSPKNFGRIPGGQTTGLTFNLSVSPTFSTQAQPVTLTLTLDGKARGVRLSRATYAFNHVINADKEALHFSTDYPNGGREVRDYNRNLQIDRPDLLDPFKGVFWPDEDVTFSSMFVADSVGPPTLISNILGEDLNNDGDNTDAGEGDIIPNQQVDKGILLTTNPANVQRVPWNFDRNEGGWLGLRHPDSKPGISIGVANIWEYETSGACGAQTTIPDGDTSTPLFQSPGAAGMWHTGDTVASTPTGQTCDKYPYPHDPETEAFEEFAYDILVSPIIAKVHQRPDSLGFPYTVEFQRLGVNMNIQTADYAGGAIDFDTNLEDDAANCILCNYFYYRFGDQYTLVSFNSYTYGIDPLSNAPQRTFGPLIDPDHSVTLASKSVTGDEKGFSGFTDDTNPDSDSPIPTAGPSFRPFPNGEGLIAICESGDPNTDNDDCVPGNPADPCVVSGGLCTSLIPGICDGGTHNGDPCITAKPTDPCITGLGVCTPENNSIAGPERSMDIVLLDYQDGIIYLSLGPGQGEPVGAFAPGPPGNRWQIGIGFWAMEQTAEVTDYGFGADDVVLEWDEVHPIPEATAACTKFGGSGQPAGQQCATLTIDRLALYECNETVGITVNDPRRAGVGAVTVFGVTDSDADVLSTGVVVAKHPRKSFSIPETATPGVFKGNVTLGTLFNNANLLFTNPGNDSNMTFYYIDPECDGDRDGTVNESSFTNLDNDGVNSPPDNCPFTYNPLQEDGACSGGASSGTPCLDSSTCGTGTCVIDGDNVGSRCDNCPVSPNADQRDSDADDVGDACDFDDIDFDGVVNALDNCPDVYNFNQVPGGGQATRGFACNDQNADIDGDGQKDRLDNCVRTPNFNAQGVPPQPDEDLDGIGDACDGDCGNPQKVTLPIGSCVRSSHVPCANDGACPVTGSCFTTPTRSCVVEGDCPGKGTCERNVGIECNNDGQCPVTGTCSNNPTKVCISNDECPGGTCQNIAQEICRKCGPQSQETCEREGVTNNGLCGEVEDDYDADAVTDAIDNCPTVPNPSLLTGVVLQADTDQDGRGEICDPPQTLDDDNNGIPDDAVTFNTAITCKKLPLANLIVLAVKVADINGDLDSFADAGETARMALIVRNASSFDLTSATLVLGSIDPKVACITKSTIFVPLLGAGDTLDTSTLGDPAGKFEYTLTQNANTTNPASPAKANFILSVVSAQSVGSPIPITTVIDLDLPTGGLPARLNGDGKWREDFDTERDGTRACKLANPQACNEQTPCPSGQVCVNNSQCALATTTACKLDSECSQGQICADPFISISSRPLGTQGVQNDTQGVWVGTAPGGINSLAGVGCAGFLVPPQDPACKIDPDNDMDWHIHCPVGKCPNGQGFITPADGIMSYSGANSLHWGHHFDPGSRDGDSVKFRQLAAFMTNEINLTPLPEPGDLELSFFHIADMMDNNSYNLPPGQANDFGDVHIQVFDPSAPPATRWGVWDRLAPFQNVYDHISYIWSAFGTAPTYCILTPADSGTAPPAPRGVRELMCYPNGIWSHCGNSREPVDTGQCEGPGSLGQSGPGLWVQSKFSLANYLGQRIRIRWIAQAWEFDCCASSYYELGGTWGPQPGDEGWWIDDIQVTGALVDLAQPPPDTKPVGPQNCPGAACDASQGDGGFNVDLVVQTADGDNLFVAGEAVSVSAAGTSNPGKCVGGGVQFRFFKRADDRCQGGNYAGRLCGSNDDAYCTLGGGGTSTCEPAFDVVQDWSSDPTYIDNPTADAEYHVQARCSVFPGCTSTASASAAIESFPVYPGDGTDIVLMLTHTTGTTTISWPSRMQSPLVSGYDLYKGTINSAGDIGLATLAGLTCLSGNIPQPPGSPGQPVSGTEAINPALGTATYFLAGHSPVAAGGQAALGRGCGSPTTPCSTGVTPLRALPPVCP